MNSTTNELTHAVVGMAIEVHRELGPGSSNRLMKSVLPMSYGNPPLNLSVKNPYRSRTKDWN
jgi:hypothetical protein